MTTRSLKYDLPASLLLLIVLSLLGNTSCSGQNKQTTDGASILKQGKVTAIGMEGGRPIPLYGFNGNNVQGPSWSTPALMSQIKNLHLQIIRYPGGTISDWWDWKTGWFLNSPELPAKFKKGKKVDIGLNELKALVDQTHCQVVFTLNMISATLEDQIQMLQHAQQTGIPVKWIEMGNEVNLSQKGEKQKFPQATLYAGACQNWIAAIKQHFPEAEIAIVGGDKSDNAKASLYAKRSTAKNWNSVLKTTNTKANAFVYHCYPSLKTAGFDFSEIYNAIVDDYNEQGFNKIGSNIWVTEYNISWAFMPNRNNNIINQYAASWGNALGIILMTSTLTHITDNITMMLNHNLTGNPRFTAIETQNKSFNLSSNGIAMKSWLEVSDGMSTMQKIQFADNQGRRLPDYEIFGWKFSNGTKYKVILVNLSKDTLSVSLNPVFHAPLNYTSLYANKDEPINGLSSVRRNNSHTQQGMLNLLPYSITTLKE